MLASYVPDSLEAHGRSKDDTDKLDRNVDSDDIDVSKELPSRSPTPSPEELKVQNRARLKMDLILLPVMAMFYFLAFLDRTNIGNARVAGLQTALRMTDLQYQLCVTILFIPFICSELPGNLILRKIGANLFLPSILTMWGIVVLCQGFVSSYRGLLAIRFLIGLLEGPMAPGVTLYLSEGFYTRRELSLRLSCFFSAASLAGAFSSLLAAAIMKMDGIGGKGGWSWIFILEGLLTVAVGICSFWLVPRTMQELFWLTQAEKDALKWRFERDRPAINAKNTFTPKEVLRSLASPHVLFMVPTSFMGGTVVIGLAYFLPSIVRQLGFSPLQSQLLSIGPFFVGAIVCLATAWYSDKYNTRGPFLVVMTCVSIAGWAMFLALDGKYAMYAALYLMVPGIYANVPVRTAWIANNSEPYYRRATSIAISTAASNAGGILGIWRFPSNEGPKFMKTTLMILIFLCTSVVFHCLNMIYLSRQNKVKQRLRQEILAPYSVEEEPDGGFKAWVELGDRHPDFKYTV